jgi:crotonobetainyl-CoA:carnitine CoA-transferase CaiB-like acyl-CoA transferase
MEPRSNNPMTTSPLAGYTVIDLTANMAGPYGTMILAEQGAEVIKVEPPSGDVIRKVGSGRDGMSGYFANLNRGKRSIGVDLRAEAGVDIVRRLARQADVVVQSYRPGVAGRLGIGPDDLCANAPQLIYVSISGFGPAGPYANEPAYDHVIQALTGMATLQSDLHDGSPQLIRHGVVDKSTGMAVAQAVTGALLRRCREGVRSHVEISMLDTALHFMWPDGMSNHTCLDPVDIHPAVSRVYRLTATADGHVSIVTVTDKQWNALVRAVGMEERSADLGLHDARARMKNGGQLMREVAKEIARMPTIDVIERLRAFGVPCMPVSALDDVAAHEQIAAAGSLVETDHPVLGRVRQPRSPIRIDDAVAGDIRPAPVLGADTDEVLERFGWSAADVAALRKNQVVF